MQLKQNSSFADSVLENTFIPSALLLSDLGNACVCRPHSMYVCNSLNEAFKKSEKFEAAL